MSHCLPTIRTINIRAIFHMKKNHNTEFFSMQIRATVSKKLKINISMHKTASDTKRMAFAVQSLRHAKTPQYISSIVIFPFSVNPVQPGIYHG